MRIVGRHFRGFTRPAPRAALLTGLLLALAVGGGCRPRGDTAASDLRIFNGKVLTAADPGYHGVLKLYYKRRVDGAEAEFASTAFLAGPNVILTSGHTLVDDPYDIELGLPDGGRFRLGITRTLASLREFERQYRRGPVWAGGGETVKESWDFGAVVLAGDLLAPWAPLPLARWPAALAAPVTVIGTGRNDKSTDWRDTSRISGDFKVFETDDMMFTYRMDAPGTPYTAVGDSGGPVLARGRVVGIHAGNYADPAISVGYASALTFGGARASIERIRALGGKGMDPLLEGLDWLACIRKHPDLGWWLPVGHARVSGRRTVAAVGVKGWLDGPAFTAAGGTHGGIREEAPWIESKSVASQVETALIEIETCRLHRSRTIALERPQRFRDLGLVVQSDGAGFSLAIGTATPVPLKPGL